MAEFNIRSNISDVLGNFQTFSGFLRGGFTAAVGTARAALTALAANPIGAILAALAVIIGVVIRALSSFQPFVDRVSQASAAFSAVISVLVDRIALFVEGLVELARGNFAEAFDKLRRSITGVADEVEREGRAAARLERARQRLEDRNIREITLLAELNVVTREHLRLSADQTRSTEERIKSLEAAERAISANFSLQRIALDEEIRILEEQQALGNNLREDDRELAELRAQRINLNAEESGQLREIQGQRSGLILQEERLAAMRQATLNTREVQILEAENEAYLETLMRIGTSEEEIARTRVELAEEVFDKRLELAQTEEEREQILHERRLFRIRQESMVQGDAIRDEIDYEAQRQQLADQRIEALGNIGDFLTTLAGESKGLAIAGLVIEQAAAIAGIVTSTLRASASALVPPPVGLGPVAGAPLAAAIQIGGAASVGAAIAATVQGINQINATPGPSASGVAGAGGASGIAFGPTVSTPLAAGPVTSASGDSSTIVAVVTSGDINNANERNARARNKRRLGGS